MIIVEKPALLDRYIMKVSRKDKMKQGQGVAYYEALLSKRTDSCMELLELLEQLRV